MKINYLILLLLFNLNLSASELTDSIFYGSNKLYESGSFEEAINGYLSILNQDIDHQVLYYNIGNSYYKLDKLGYARLYYEKAKLYDLHDKDINHNIEILERQLIDDINVIPEFIFIRILKQFNNILSPFQWGCASLLALYLSVILFLVFLFSTTPQTKMNSLKGLFFLIPVLLLVLFFTFYSNRESKYNHAVLISPNAYIKTAPSEGADDYFVIHDGVKFKIIDSLDDWSRVLLPDGKDGWIKNQHFLTIDK